jgi:4-hydroxy-tetrahydrodipicolinate reductase
MRELIRVLVLGAGSMGRAILRVLLEKEGLEVVGVCDRDAGLVGSDAGELCGAGRKLGVAVEGDLGTAIAVTRPEVAIQATCSSLSDAWPDVRALLESGVHVISIAEEMTYPRCRSAALAEKMDELAAANGVVALGTGINPGFMMDLLLITLTGICTRVDRISAVRVNDLSPYGGTVLRAQGVGLSPDAFDDGIRDGTVTGHVGFPESMHLIGAALGWPIDRIEQSREPIVATQRLETERAVVQKGQVAGCRHRASAYRGDEVVISFDHPQLIRPELAGLETEDRLEIQGTPRICLSGSPEIAGGLGTAAIAVNMIPRVLSARPGLRTMAELPVPSALEADARRFVLPREQAHG